MVLVMTMMMMTMMTMGLVCRVVFAFELRAPQSASRASIGVAERVGVDVGSPPRAWYASCAFVARVVSDANRWT